MSVFLIDTDTLSLLGQKNPVVLRNVNGHPSSDINLCSVSLQEQMRGFLAAVNSAPDEQILAQVHQLLINQLMPTWTRFAVLPFTLSAIRRFEKLRAMRLNVGLMDLRIGSIALEYSLTVVTRNQRDFGRIPGLTVIDWSV